MALPITRPRTYAANTPIVPADLNDLFDAIIGKKHPEIEFPIAASAFQKASGTATLAIDEWSSGGGGAIFSAPLTMLCVGDLITTVTFYYLVGAGGSVTYELRKRNVASGVTTTLQTAVDITNAGVLEAGVLTANVVVATGYNYFLDVITGGAVEKLDGASLKKSRL